MNTQHTPGPWTTDGSAESGNLDIISPLGRVAMMDCDHDLTAIDAQLIAAAPDLLAALQKIDANAAESVEWIRRVAREAIAKAEAA